MRYLIAETSWMMISLAQTLSEQGHLLTRCERAEDVALMVGMGGIDAVLIDETSLGLAGVDLPVLRAAAGIIPIILTADAPDRARIAKWLNAGADTILDAAYHPSEMIARILAVARRSHGYATSQLSFGPLEIDVERRRVALDGVYLHLTPKVYELLECMALRAGKLVTRDALLSHIYGLDAEPDARVFDVYICTLRRHLKAANGAVQIQTARGKGFRFHAQNDAAQAA